MGVLRTGGLNATFGFTSTPKLMRVILRVLLKVSDKDEITDPNNEPDLSDIKPYDELLNPFREPSKRLSQRNVLAALSLSCSTSEMVGSSAD